MNEEICKDIVGFEGHYQISSFGRVKSLARLRTTKGGGLSPVREKILKQKITKNGYLSVHLRKDDTNRHATVHRLVAETFISNPDGKLTVNHIDCIKSNNLLENLEWATHSEQLIHAVSNDLLVKRGKPKFSPAFQEEVKKHVVDTGMSISKTAIHFDISERSVSRMINDQCTGPVKKITDAEVKLIIEMRKQGKTLLAISKMFDCGISQVHRITRGQSRLEQVYER